MKKVLFLMAITMALFTSCDSGEMKNETIITTYMVSREVNLLDPEIDTYNSLCTYRIDLVNLKMSISIKDPSDKNTNVLVLNNISLKNTTEGYKFDEASIIPIVDGKPDPENTITNLKGVIFGQEITYSFNTTKSTIYSSVEDPVYRYSNTTVVDVANPTNPFHSKTVQCQIEMDVDKMVADINLAGAQFADKMPPMNMTIPNVPVIATASGFTLDIESVIPVIGKTPYPNYKMTNLKATMVGQNLSLSFICADKFNTTILATMHEPKLPK